MELNETLKGKEAFPGIIHETPGGGIVVSTFDSIINWARSNSLWPCCHISPLKSRNDVDWLPLVFIICLKV